MISHDWKLTVQFGYDYDEDPKTGEQEALEFQRFVLADWGVDESDIGPLQQAGELITEGDTVTVAADVLDYLDRLVYYVLLHTIPKKLEITRQDG